MFTISMNQNTGECTVYRAANGTLFGEVVAVFANLVEANAFVRKGN